jgi:hypothetical protein
MKRTISAIAAPPGHQAFTIAETSSGVICVCGRRFRDRAALAAHHDLERMLAPIRKHP